MLSYGILYNYFQTPAVMTRHAMKGKCLMANNGNAWENGRMGECIKNVNVSWSLLHQSQCGYNIKV